MRPIVIAVLATVLGCGGAESSSNACATPSRVVSCDEQNFYTFRLTSTSGESPTWIGNQCAAKPCSRGDACEVLIDGAFAEGVCE